MKFTKSIKKNHQFRFLYHKGRSHITPFLALYSKNHRNKRANYLGITVGTKLGNAVKRNKVRRRLLAIYRIHEAELKPGYSMVVVARNRAATATYQELERSFLSLLKKHDLLLVVDKPTEEAI
ncbi:MAG: ribonuclease P protein component [Eubacteriales bacterium]